MYTGIRDPPAYSIGKSRQMNAPHQQLPDSLPLFKSLPRLQVSAALNTHPHHICIPAVLAQTHSFCKPHTWPPLGHCLLPIGISEHRAHTLVYPHVSVPLFLLPKLFISQKKKKYQQLTFSELKYVSDTGLSTSAH